jgi:hypothetical protein
MPLRVQRPAYRRGLQTAAPPPLQHGPGADGDPRRWLRSGFHELLAATPGDEAVTLAFTLSLAAWAAAQTGKGICFCGTASDAQERGQLYGHGLTTLGVTPGRIITVTAPGEKHLLWTLEEAVTSGAFGAVVGALPAGERFYGFAASRRLKLRTTAKVTPLFLIRHWSGEGATAAHGRWRVGNLPSQPEVERSGVPLVGAPRLHLSLERMGGLLPQHWEVAFDVTRGFDLVSFLADGPARKTGGPQHQAA